MLHVLQIQQFQKRFKKIPKIIELDHLTVTGDVYFGRNVTLRGTVIGEWISFIFAPSASADDFWIHPGTDARVVVANEGQRIDIPDGCVLENSTSICPVFRYLAHRTSSAGLLSGNLTMTVREENFLLQKKRTDLLPPSPMYRSCKRVPEPPTVFVFAEIPN